MLLIFALAQNDLDLIKQATQLANKTSFCTMLQTSPASLKVATFSSNELINRQKRLQTKTKKIAMRKQKYYRYNKQTLQYEEIKAPIGRRILKYTLTVSATAVYAWGVWTLATPTSVKAYLLEKAHLKQKIEASSANVDKMLGELAHLKERDDNLYRSTLELNKIDESTWEGGVGGSVKHPELERLSDGKVLVELAQKIQKANNQLVIVSESQDALLSKAGTEEKKMRAVPAIRPVLNLERPLSQLSGFGMRRDPVNKSVWQMHPGLDIGAPQGTPIFSTGDGVIVRVEYKSNGYGLNVVVDHGYGYKTLYAHMSIIEAKVGQKVKRGEVVGYVGSTGYSTCPHVHYEVFFNEKRIDPVPFIASMTNEEFKELAKTVNPNISFAPKSGGSRRRR